MKIINHYTKETIFESDHKTVKKCLIAAVAAKTNLMHADLKHASLYGADLQGANFLCADFRHANLTNTDLRGVDFRETKFYGAYFHHANLCYANLQDADLRGVDFRGAKGFKLLPVQDMRGYSFAYATLCDDEWRIRSGCRDFTINQAKEHWGNSYIGDRAQGDLYLYAVEWLEKETAP